MSNNALRESLRGTPYATTFGIILDRLELIEGCLDGQLKEQAELKAMEKQDVVDRADKARIEIHDQIAKDEQLRRKERQAR